jgi:hypothetical protein
MSSRLTLRNMLALWLVRRGSRMLSKPCWAIGAIVSLTRSRDQLAVHTCVIVPKWDPLPSAVNSALSALLCDIASGKATSQEHQALYFLQHLGHGSDGSPDEKSLH